MNPHIHGRRHPKASPPSTGTRPAPRSARGPAVNDWFEAGLEEQHLAVEVVEDADVGRNAVAGIDRHPRESGAPEPEDTGPRGGVIAREHRPLGPTRQPEVEQRVRDPAGKPADLVETIGTLPGDVGDAAGVGAPTPVEEVDDGHDEAPSRPTRWRARAAQGSRAGNGGRRPCSRR
jgi:hypothetical protein